MHLQVVNLVKLSKLPSESFNLGIKFGKIIPHGKQDFPVYDTSLSLNRENISIKYGIWWLQNPPLILYGVKNQVF